MAPIYIGFLFNYPIQISNIRRDFYNSFGFPNVLGCIDGVHIALRKPTTDPVNYFNRKGYYRLNVQAICDSDLRFLNIYVRWPGGSYDSFIRNQSGFREALNSWPGTGYLLGDSGNQCEGRLLTPFRNPRTAAEERYQTAHIRTRNCIERCFGVLKNRFRCLDKSEGTLLYKPEKVQNIILAACVLHNWCIKERVSNPEIGINQLPVQEDDHLVVDCNNIGIQIRQALVDGIFNQ